MNNVEALERVKMANSSIDKLAKADDAIIRSESIFGKNKWMDLNPETMRLFTDKNVIRNELIHTKNLHFTQDTMQKGGVKKYISAKVDPKNLPEAVKLKNGGFLILDGHHRAAAQVLKRFTGMRVNVVGEEM